ncbi:hypothetical protein LSAT2_022566, partial [Lamellibrachia satsuma]
DAVRSYDRSRLSAVDDKFKDSESLVYAPARDADPEVDSFYSCVHSDIARIQRDDLVNPCWITDPQLGRGPVRYLDANETQFWQKLIDKYLYPIDHEKEHQAKIITDLKTLRNNAAFLFFMLNFIWLFVIVLLQASIVSQTH